MWRCTYIGVRAQQNYSSIPVPLIVRMYLEHETLDREQEGEKCFRACTAESSAYLVFKDMAKCGHATGAIA